MPESIPWPEYAKQAVSDEGGGPCLLRYYRRGINLGADDELLVTLGLRQLERLRRMRWGL